MRTSPQVFLCHPLPRSVDQDQRTLPVNAGQWADDPRARPVVMNGVEHHSNPGSGFASCLTGFSNSGKRSCSDLHLLTANP